VAFEDDLLDLERRVLREAAGDWLGSIDELKRLLAMESPTLRAAVLSLLAPRIEDVALVGLLEAANLGAEDAATIARDADLSDEALAQLDAATRAVIVRREQRNAIKGLDKAAESALDKAHKLLAAGAAIEAVLSPLFESANHTRLVLETTINATANEAVIDVADAVDLALVWVAERNACVTCLAYAGQVARDRAPFPGGLTFGRKSYNPEAIKGPPRHPHCRCHLEPLVADEYAEALRREAERSVLRGYSLENESMGVRVDAAERLLARGTDAPKSVQAVAARAVKRGQFPTRLVPNGRAGA
jgi:hypothetical protein